MKMADYVIFSVATIDVTPGGLRYVDLGRAQFAIHRAASGSHHRAENAFRLSKTAWMCRRTNQLLLLIACTKDDNGRRVIRRAPHPHG